jgi:hypothetical protein
MNVINTLPQREFSKTKVPATTGAGSEQRFVFIPLPNIPLPLRFTKRKLV